MSPAAQSPGDRSGRTGASTAPSAAAARLRVLGVRPGEGRSAALMTAHSFFMGTSTVFFETAASALFLSQFESHMLPWVYIGAAVLNILTGSIYSIVKERVSFGRLMAGTLLFLLASVCAVRLGLALTNAAWLVFASLVWYRVLSILTDLEYWAVAARLYDVRQAKRLFGLIGSGEVVARIGGAFSVPVLVRIVGVSNLLLFSAAGLGLCLFFLVAVLKNLAGRASSAEWPSLAALPRQRKRLRQQFREVLSHPYLALITSLAVLAVLGKYFVDFAFLEQMRSRFHDVSRLAGFFGLFSGLTQGLSLLIRLFVSGPLLTRFGIRVGLLVLPLAHLACTLLILLLGSLGGSEAGLVFWMVIANQGVYKTLKHPIDNPSFKVLYQPLKADQRLSAQIAVEAIFTPITIGIAGAIMLLMSTVVRYDPVHFAYLLFGNFALWAVFAHFGSRAYTRALQDVLKRRVLDDSPFSLGDATSVALLRGRLESATPAEAMFALHLLERAEYPRLTEMVISKLAHPAAEVRRYAFERLEALAPATAFQAIRQRLSAETDPAALSAALRAAAAIGADGVARDLLPYLHDADPVVRRGAMTGLLRLRDDPAREEALARLRSAASSPSASERTMAAQVAGELRIEGVLVPLLEDPDIHVRRVAFTAAGRLAQSDLWPALIGGLSRPAFAGAAVAALATAGDAVIEELEKRFVPEAPAGVQIQIARVYGLVRSPAAVEKLRARLAHPDASVRTHVLEALSQCGYRALGDGRAAVVLQVRREAEHAAFALAAWRDLGTASELETLRAALLSEVGLSRRRAFLLLSFLYDRRAILRARDNIAHASRDRRAYALEVLDVTVEGEVRATAMPLLDELQPGERASRLALEFPQSSLPVAGRLREIFAKPEGALRPWTRAAAAHAVAVSELPLASALAGVRSGDTLVRETVSFALERLGSASAAAPKERSMLLIEKVMLLKGVQMFAESSEEILTEIAAILEEVEITAGEVVLRKGDVGDSMYIVAFGQVRVFDGDRTIRTLGEKEIFGELALLDPEPRSASVAAFTDSRLFRIDAETFSQLMAGNIEIVRGVLHVLCDRLRRVTALELAAPRDQPPSPPARV